jgi:hypothetical protein
MICATRAAFHDYLQMDVEVGERNERVFDPPHDLHRRELQRGVGQESDL